MKWLWFFLILSACASQSVHASPPTYTVTDLGTLGGTTSSGTALSDTSQVSGSAYIADDAAQNAFLSGANGAQPLVNLGTLGGSDSFGQAINSSGQVAGTSSMPTAFVFHAFVTGPNGAGLTDLSTLGGALSYGYGINGDGRVAGYSSTADGSTLHAFLSVSRGGLQDLGTLPGGTNSFGLAVNASGQVTGYSGTASGNNHAFISGTSGGVLRDLGTLGGSSSVGAAINDSGQVVGRSEVSGIGQHAFRSEANGGPLLDLNTLGGYSSFGEGINSAGAVVGYSYLRDNSTQHAFLYTTTYGLLDLNNLLTPGSGWVLTDARAISNQGRITGIGTVGGSAHAFLLVPVLPPLSISSIAKLSNGHMLITGTGGAFQNYGLESSASVDGNFVRIATVAAGTDGSLRFEDAGSAGLTRQFYRFVYP